MLPTNQQAFPLPEPDITESFEILYRKEMAELTEKYHAFYNPSLVGRLDCHATLIEEGKLDIDDKIIAVDTHYFLAEKFEKDFNEEHKKRYKEVLIKLKPKFFEKETTKFCELAAALIFPTTPEYMTEGEWINELLELDYDTDKLNEIFKTIKEGKN